mgnify:CR=1 FL=1
MEKCIVCNLRLPRKEILRSDKQNNVTDDARMVYIDYFDSQSLNYQ